MLRSLASGRAESWLAGQTGHKSNTCFSIARSYVSGHSRPDKVPTCHGFQSKGLDGPEAHPSVRSVTRGGAPRRTGRASDRQEAGLCFTHGKCGDWGHRLSLPILSSVM